MKKLYFFCLGFLFFSVGIHGQSMSFAASADNTIYQEFPGNSNGIGENIFAGNTAASNKRRALLKFDINIPVPLGYSVVITSAMLTLTMNKSIATASNISLYPAVAAWGEGNSDAGGQEGRGITALVNDATWTCAMASGGVGCLTAWAGAGGDYNTTPSATTSVGPALGDYSWTSGAMAADVQTWFDDPSQNFGWILIGNETAPTTANRFGSRENPTVASRPLLAVTYNLLPVKFTFFKATETKGGNMVSWETAQEFSNSYFEVEHSRDGRNFSVIGRVNGNGNTSIPHSYSFMHEGISAGLHYYRLSQTDLDGRKAYTQIIRVNNKGNAYMININPNPVTDRVFLSGSGAVQGNTYRVINRGGSSVLYGQIGSDGKINVSSLQKGMYFIRLQTKTGEQLTGQFIKL